MPTTALIITTRILMIETSARLKCFRIDKCTHKHVLSTQDGGEPARLLLAEELRQAEEDAADKAAEEEEERVDK